MKKSIFIFIIIAITGLLSSCKNQTTDDSTESSFLLGAKAQYSTEYISEINMSIVHELAYYEDKLILLGVTLNEDSATEIKAVSFDSEGEIIDEGVFNYPHSDSRWYPYKATIDSSGNHWFLSNDFEFSENMITNYKGSYLDCFDKSYNHIKTIEIGDNQIDLSNVQDLIVGDDDNFYICTDEGVVAILDENGEPVFDLKDVASILKLPNGSIAARKKSSFLNSEHLFFSEIDVTQKGFGEVREFEASGNDFDSYYISGNEIFEILESTSSKLYGHSAENKSRTELVSWAEQGILESGFSTHGNIIFLGDVIYRLESTGSIPPSANDKIRLIKLTKSDELIGSDKKIISLAVMNYDSMVRRTVVEFNKQSGEYEIQVKAYMEENGRDNQSEAITSFNLDLTAGKSADIIIMDNIPIESYVSKGLFVDLYEYIDADPDMQRADYLPNMLKMLETNGKLYTISDSFIISTVAGKASEVGETRGLTWDRFNTLLEKKAVGTLPISGSSFHMTKSDFLSKSVLTSLNSFIDFETGQCYFDSPEFVELMKTADRYFPSEAGKASISDFKENRVMLMDDVLFNFSGLNIKTHETLYFEEPSIYIGFPTKKGVGGSLAQFNHKIAISSQSELKEAAWEYVKYIITDYQYTEGFNANNSGTIAGFPIKISALEKQAEIVTNKEGTVSMQVEGATVTFDAALTAREAQKVFELIYSVDNSANNGNQGIFEILQEESQYYFAGQKSVEETAAVIQSRVGLYLAERG
ncbi:MAG: hypothetical protein FWG90_03160 [Oscillospiraceae bacterium]|nr:hypothetical protein [Oscillospiraceae bacterium]